MNYGDSFHHVNQFLKNQKSNIFQKQITIEDVQTMPHCLDRLFENWMKVIDVQECENTKKDNSLETSDSHESDTKQKKRKVCK